MKKLKALALVFLLLSPAAMALTLDEARQQGLVGETLSGYIAAVTQNADAQGAGRSYQSGPSAAVSGTGAAQ